MHKPTEIRINFTHRCNLRCKHCNLWTPAFAASQGKELSYNEWIRVIIDLKEWLGPYTLNISGGEPFMREDLPDILHFCHGHEIRTVVSTNATLLDPETIRLLSGLRTLTLIISLDGSNPPTHDYLRGITGTFQKVMDVLRQFKNPSRQCSIGIATVLMGYNCDEILEILRLGHERKLADWILFQALSPNFGIPYEKGWFDKSGLWPKGGVRDRLINIISELIALKGQGVQISNPVEQLRGFQRYFINPAEDIPGRYTNCKNNFIINPRSEVLLCFNMAPVDNFSKEPGQIWCSANAKKRRAQIRRCRNSACKLLNCNFKTVTGERSLWERIGERIMWEPLWDPLWKSLCERSDRLIGLAGIFIKRHNPNLYVKLKKIIHKKNSSQK